MKSKDLFHFKQFDIRQKFAAMKVGTDGVLLGAWANTKDKRKILDIGSGTGLISLMLAQKSSAFIDAVEIDSSAQKDCQFNFQNSPWNDRLKLHSISLNHFLKSYSTHKYDLIVSNPPFFENRINNSSRDVARSQNELSFEELTSCSYELSSSNGEFAVVIPFQSFEEFAKIASNNHWFLSKKTNVKGKLNGKIIRILLQFSKINGKTIEEEICIELEQRHQYSEDYSNLLKDYLTIF